MIKSILLCADDYSQNQAITEGILLLARNKRINAISCMVNSPDWRENSRELDSIKPNNFIGLHLNLTFGNALSLQWQERYSARFTNLGNILSQSYLKRLDSLCIAAEISAQIDAFTDAMDSPPDFIDGHQHIHQIPLIRDALISVYKSKQLTSFCRNTSNGWRDLFSFAAFPKPQAISLLGGRVFKQFLAQQSIGSNTSFAGIYNFRSATTYRHYFQHFLKNSKNGGLIMCHPGSLSNDKRDPLYSNRHHELEYFMSEFFLADLRAERCQLAQKPFLTN